MPHEHPHDKAARIRRALAEDDRTSELGVTVAVLDERIHLTGSVATAARKAHVGVVAQEAEPGLHVTNDLTVVSAAEPGESEDIE